MKDMLVLRVVANFIIPFIIVFAFYIQLHGEYSPGGGFQAGVILASSFILFSLIWGLSACREIMPDWLLRLLACTGVLLYAGTGIACMFLGGTFLDYDVLSSTAVGGQHLGIFLVELGVGMTVFAVMMQLYVAFVARKTEGKQS